MGQTQSMINFKRFRFQNKRSKMIASKQASKNERCGITIVLSVEKLVLVLAVLTCISFSSVN